MTTTWSILIDWDRNGNFTDVNDDLGNRIIEAQWFLGQQTAYDHVADGVILNLVLNNYDKRFSPEYSSSVLYGKVVPFRPIKIQSNDGTTTRTHWVGWMQSIQPD